MKAEYYFDGKQPKVIIDGEWNSLSLFLESDSSFSEVKNHIELKKPRPWIGNTSAVNLISGSKFEVYSELDSNLGKTLIFQKQLLKLMEEWRKFLSDKKERTIDV